MTTYTLELRLYDEEFIPKFAFHATGEQEALRKARLWAYYHTMTSEDVRVRISSEGEANNQLHNEYVEDY